MGKAEAFWDQCKKEDPKFSGFDWMISQPGWEKKYLPFFIHGDAAEFCNKDSLFTTSFHSPLGEGETRDIKHLHWSCPKSVVVKDALHWRDGSDDAEDWMVQAPRRAQRSRHRAKKNEIQKVAEPTLSRQEVEGDCKLSATNPGVNWKYVDHATRADEAA